MRTEFDIDAILKSGTIATDLEFERALIAERKLRHLAKADGKAEKKRRKLRRIINDFEIKSWDDEASITNEKILESDLAERLAERERLFYNRRKQLIRGKLKELQISQQDFGRILGHDSKSYISELMNGLSPFSMKDLVVIHRLLGIELAELIPTTMSYEERVSLRSRIAKIANTRFNLNLMDLSLDEIL